MLLIQDISLIWDKNERTAKYSKARRNFQPAYLLDNISDLTNKEIILNSLNFYQNENEIMDSIQNSYMWFHSKEVKKLWTEEQIHQRIIQDEIHIKKFKYQFYSSVKDLNVANILFKQIDSDYEITFCYDERRGRRPVRRGHNKDFNCPKSSQYRLNILNETAFVLKPKQYGRIIYNEREKGHDTGIWYYRLHIINIINSSVEMFKNNIFTSCTLDYQYTQLADLY